MHMLEKGNISNRQPAHPVHIIDGNNQFHTLIGIPDTFGELAQKVFNNLSSFKHLDFITDSYKEQSIKGRTNRGNSDVFIVQGPKVKVPRDFKKFFANTKNKIQLFRLILKEWYQNKYASKLHNRELYYVLEDDCYLLTSGDGRTTTSTEIPRLKCTQVI